VRQKSFHNLSLFLINLYAGARFVIASSDFELKLVTIKLLGTVNVPSMSLELTAWEWLAGVCIPAD
jgi:hypothetical protein